MQIMSKCFLETFASSVIATKTWCNNVGHVGQPEKCDPAPTPGVWNPVCARGAQVQRKTSKLISSFPQGWSMKDRQGEPHDLHAALQKSEQGERGGRVPLSFCIFSTLSSAYVPPAALGTCYDNQKWRKERARSDMKRFQGFWHEREGGKDLCWEVCSLEIQPSARVPSGRRGKLSGPTSDCCAEWRKQIELPVANRSLSSGTCLCERWFSVHTQVILCLFIYLFFVFSNTSLCHFNHSSVKLFESFRTFWFETFILLTLFTTNFPTGKKKKPKWNIFNLFEKHCFLWNRLQHIGSIFVFFFSF